MKIVWNGCRPGSGTTTDTKTERMDTGFRDAVPEERAGWASEWAFLGTCVLLFLANAGGRSTGADPCPVRRLDHVYGVDADAGPDLARLSRLVPGDVDGDDGGDAVALLSLRARAE
jgi:hypothetical protein